MRFNSLRGTVGVPLQRVAIGALALLLGSGLTVAAVKQASAAAACSVGYTIASQWTPGFQTNLAITNLGDPITSWTLEWDFAAGQQITQLWNGTATQTGAHVSVTNLSYNGSIATNAAVSSPPGFTGTWSGSNPIPASFKLNGTVCTGVGPTPTPTGTPTGTPTPTPTGGTPTPTPTGTPTPTPTPTNTGPHPANPYPGATQYLNPDYVAEVQAQASADGSAAEARVATWQTAIWMDRKAAITGDATHRGLQAQLDNALTQQKSGTTRGVRGRHLRPPGP